LDQPPFLAREPFYQANRPFKNGARWRELPIDARPVRVMEDRALQGHSGREAEIGHREQDRVKIGLIWVVERTIDEYVFVPEIVRHASAA
jgi:hypothetical protein